MTLMYLTRSPNLAKSLRDNVTEWKQRYKDICVKFWLPIIIFIISAAAVNSFGFACIPILRSTMSKFTQADKQGIEMSTFHFLQLW